jgi:hypothetical protein
MRTDAANLRAMQDSERPEKWRIKFPARRIEAAGYRFLVFETEILSSAPFTEVRYCVHLYRRHRRRICVLPPQAGNGFLVPPFFQVVLSLDQQHSDRRESVGVAVCCCTHFLTAVRCIGPQNCGKLPSSASKT